MRGRIFGVEKLIICLVLVTSNFYQPAKGEMGSRYLPVLPGKSIDLTTEVVCRPKNIFDQSYTDYLWDEGFIENVDIFDDELNQIAQGIPLKGRYFLDTNNKVCGQTELPCIDGKYSFADYGKQKYLLESNVVIYPKFRIAVDFNQYEPIVTRLDDGSVVGTLQYDSKDYYQVPVTENVWIQAESRRTFDDDIVAKYAFDLANRINIRLDPIFRYGNGFIACSSFIYDCKHSKRIEVFEGTDISQTSNCHNIAIKKDCIEYMFDDATKKIGKVVRFDFSGKEIESFNVPMRDKDFFCIVGTSGKLAMIHERVKPDECCFCLYDSSTKKYLWQKNRSEFASVSNGCSSWADHVFFDGQNPVYFFKNLHGAKCLDIKTGKSVERIFPDVTFPCQIENRNDVICATFPEKVTEQRSGVALIDEHLSFNQLKLEIPENPIQTVIDGDRVNIFSYKPSEDSDPYKAYVTSCNLKTGAKIQTYEVDEVKPPYWQTTSTNLYICHNKDYDLQCYDLISGKSFTLDIGIPPKIKTIFDTSQFDYFGTNDRIFLSVSPFNHVPKENFFEFDRETGFLLSKREMKGGYSFKRINDSTSVLLETSKFTIIRDNGVKLEFEGSFAYATPKKLFYYIENELWWDLVCIDLETFEKTTFLKKHNAIEPFRYLDDGGFTLGDRLYSSDKIYVQNIIPLAKMTQVGSTYIGTPNRTKRNYATSALIRFDPCATYKIERVGGDSFKITNTRTDGLTGNLAGQLWLADGQSDAYQKLVCETKFESIKPGESKIIKVDTSKINSAKFKLVVCANGMMENPQYSEDNKVPKYLGSTVSTLEQKAVAISVWDK